jgi:hypothetical protein
LNLLLFHLVLIFWLFLLWALWLLDLVLRFSLNFGGLMILIPPVELYALLELCVDVGSGICESFVKIFINLFESKPEILSGHQNSAQFGFHRLYSSRLSVNLLSFFQPFSIWITVIIFRICRQINLIIKPILNQRLSQHVVQRIGDWRIHSGRGVDICGW